MPAMRPTPERVERLVYRAERLQAEIRKLSEGDYRAADERVISGLRLAKATNQATINQLRELQPTKESSHDGH